VTSGRFGSAKVTRADGLRAKPRDAWDLRKPQGAHFETAPFGEGREYRTAFAAGELEGTSVGKLAFNFTEPG
jgi:hypothetical protein